MAKRTNFRDSLKHKRRELHDLSNFVGTRAGEIPNYSLLLGSGCSVTSGIRSAAQLVEIWRRDMYEKLAPSESPPYSCDSAVAYFSREQSQWYNSTREYSSLFEKKFDLPPQRRMFVESEVAKKMPSIGYAYLMQLVTQRYFNTIFTTNFDDLLNEAFHYFSDERPIVCAHDSSISSITVTSTRPKIIKLHGDYLFDDIKSTQRETESLEENTKKKFVEFSRDFGLVVVGYSGCDRSIMDVLHNLLRNEEYLKNGIYWCVRPGDEAISEELEKLLWRERVYWVEIDGFDEVMAELYSNFFGSALPVDTSLVSEKPRKIIQSFCENKFLEHSECGIVQSHLSRLRRELQKEQLVDAFRGMRDSASDEADRPANSLRDDQAAKLMRIRQLISAHENKKAKEILSAELLTSERDYYFSELAKLKFEVDTELGHFQDARAVVEMLKEYDPNDPTYAILAANAEKGVEAKSAQLRNSLALEPYNTLALNRLAALLLEQSDGVAGKARTDLVEEGIASYRNSMAIDPSIRNPAWSRLGRFLISSNHEPKPARLATVDEIIALYQAMSPRDIDLLKLRIERWSQTKLDRDSAEADCILAEIVDLRKIAPRYRARRMDLVQLHAFDAFRRTEQLKRRVSEFDLDESHVKAHDYNYEVSCCYSGSLGNLEMAIARALRAFEIFASSKYVMVIAQLAAYTRDTQILATNREKFVAQLSADEILTFRLFEAQASDNHDAALKLIRAAQSQSGEKHGLAVEETHELLYLGLSGEAETVARKHLDAVSFSPYFGALIINFELARRAQGRNVNKGRLGELVNKSDDQTVRGCAYYLMEDLASARKVFAEEIETDPSAPVRYGQWFIFDDDRGRQFLESIAVAA